MRVRLRNPVLTAFLQGGRAGWQARFVAALTIACRTEQGASNRFEVELVYALNTDAHEIASPMHPEIKIRSAPVENIIVDKISAGHRFWSVNIKDERLR